MSTLFKSQFQIGPYTIGENNPPLIVAEIGGNHGGHPYLARQMIDAAAQAGAGAVKFQAYHTESFLSRCSEYFDELASEELSLRDLAGLNDHARSRGMLFLASVFGFRDLDFLAGIGLPAIKISSGDIDNFPLLEATASYRRPVILSTGASDLGDIENALNFLADRGANEVMLLQCTSLYPCPDAEANIRAIPEMTRKFGVPVGFSDHTLGVDVALGAVALGACLVEKHFTIQHDLPGGDNDISLLPRDLKALTVGSARIAEARGNGRKAVSPGENGVAKAIRRSVVARRSLKPGDSLKPDSLALKRPGGGISPAQMDMILGRQVAAPMAPDEPLTWEKVR
jgi:N,N'-diacetyllegionaminate synthase